MTAGALAPEIIEDGAAVSPAVPEGAIRALAGPSTPDAPRRPLRVSGEALTNMAYGLGITRDEPRREAHAREINKRHALGARVLGLRPCASTCAACTEHVVVEGGRGQLVAQRVGRYVVAMRALGAHVRAALARVFGNARPAVLRAAVPAHVRHFDPRSVASGLDLTGTLAVAARAPGIAVSEGAALVD